MSYNIKNARNGKIILKTAKWLSLRPLACKSKFIQHFEFSEHFKILRISMEIVAGEHGLAL